jgi:hypothetical protein
MPAPRPIATVMLILSFTLLLLINGLQAWSWARIGGTADMNATTHTPPGHGPGAFGHALRGAPGDA